MDLNLKALIGITYLIPIAITLRKIYTPIFDMPEPLALAVAKLDVRSVESRHVPRHAARSFDLHA